MPIHKSFNNKDKLFPNETEYPNFREMSEKPDAISAGRGF